MTVCRRLVLGIDISKADFHVALLPADGTSTAPVLDTATFQNSSKGFKQLSAWLKSRTKGQLKGVKREPVRIQLHACMEASGRYGERLAFYLHHIFEQSEHRVSVVNPLLPKAFMQSSGQRNKTDKQDAIGIARYCASQDPPPWQPPSPDQQELKALTRYVEELKSTREQERNRLSGGVTSRAVGRQIKEHIDFINKQLKELEAEIETLLKKSQEFSDALTLLLSIPAIGMTTAAHFLAEVPNIHNFDHAAQLVAFAGLNPSQHQSGSSVKKKGRLSKRGNRHLRTAFYMPTLAAMRYNPVIKTFTDRLKANGKPNMVAVGAGMRKLLQLVFGVLKSGKPFDPNYAQTVLQA